MGGKGAHKVGAEVAARDVTYPDASSLTVNSITPFRIVTRTTPDLTKSISCASSPCETTYSSGSARTGRRRWMSWMRISQNLGVQQDEPK